MREEEREEVGEEAQRQVRTLEEETEHLVHEPP